jgi:hypothetical protein
MTATAFLVRSPTPAASLPPLAVGRVRVGGRKAGTPSVIVAPSGTAPHPNPPHRKRGEGAVALPAFFSSHELVR